MALIRDTSGTGRLGDTQRLRRLGETAQIDHRDQGSQQIGWDVGHSMFALAGGTKGATPKMIWLTRISVALACRSIPDAAREQRC